VSILLLKYVIGDTFCGVMIQGFFKKIEFVVNDLVDAYTNCLTKLFPLLDTHTICLEKLFPLLDTRTICLEKLQGKEEDFVLCKKYK